jgi:hypothetical protein
MEVNSSIHSAVCFPAMLPLQAGPVTKPARQPHGDAMTGTDGVAGEVCRQPLRGNGQLGIAQPAMAVSHRSSPRHHSAVSHCPGFQISAKPVRGPQRPSLMSSSIL